MTPLQAREQFRRIFTVYPSYRTFLEATPSADKTLDAWCAIVAGCEEDDVEAVVDEIVAGRREPTSRYEKPDQLPFNLRAEAAARGAKRSGKAEQEAKYHQPAKQRPGRHGDPRTYSVALRLSEMRGRQITEEENRERMEQLLAWDKGQIDAPDWLAAMLPEPRESRR